MPRHYFKKEYIVISALSIFLLVICYQLAFKRTISAWQLHQQLKSQLERSSDVAIQPEYTERKNANLDRILDFYQADTINFRSNTITAIASVAGTSNARLAGVPYRDPVYSNEQFFIQKFDFEGDYFSMMKAFQQLSRMKGAGVIRSAVLKRSGEINGDKKLIMELYFEGLNK